MSGGRKTFLNWLFELVQRALSLNIHRATCDIVTQSSQIDLTGTRGVLGFSSSRFDI